MDYLWTIIRSIISTLRTCWPTINPLPNLPTIDIERALEAVFYAFLIVAAGAILWKLLLTILTWFDASMMRMRNNVRKETLIEPDERGLLPVNLDSLTKNELTEHVVALLAAHVANSQPQKPVPHTITYAPHIKNSVEAAALDEAVSGLIMPPDHTEHYIETKQEIDEQPIPKRTKAER